MWKPGWLRMDDAAKDKAKRFTAEHAESAEKTKDKAKRFTAEHVESAEKT